MAATKKKQAKTQSNSRYIIGFWTIFGIGVLIGILIFLLAGWGAFGKMPTFEELENPETNLATEVLSADGETIGKYYNENRTPIKYEDLPEHLVQALVATEDERFYKHAGIDARGTLRAAVFLGQRGGASTITQQLAKQLFTENVSDSFLERVFQKVKEWVIATRLERQYTKEEIITMYFNKYDFVYQAVGIRSAAKIYFGKEAKDLNIQESAVLVGMLKNAALYNPVRRPDLVEDRRNVVFEQMARNGYISETEMDSLKKLPMKIDFTPEGHDEGMATYFRAYLQGFMKDWIENNPKPDGSKYSLYRDGLKIYTTIDSKMQSYAEDAVHKHIAHLQKEFDRQNESNPTAPFRDIDKDEEEGLIRQAMRRSDRWYTMKAEGKSEEAIIASFEKPREMRIFSWKGDIDTTMTPRDSIKYYKAFLQAGMMSMVPQTGEVKAWVGGTNFKHFKYDHVKQGKRQVGSTFKPFVYATAIDQLKFSPCDTMPKSRFTIEAGKFGNLKDWTPKNAGNSDYDGMVTLKQALAQSINTVTARLIDKTGPQPVIDLAEKLGIDVSEIPAVPAIALGVADISLYEMVSAFSTFANQGVYIKPVVINRIEDKNGTILYQNTPVTKDVLSKEAAYVTVNLLEGVTQSGSGVRLRGKWAGERIDYKRAVTGYPYDFTNPIAGKTGTTQNQSDGWFIGMVPDLATGVWVGGEDRSVHFPTVTYGQGATMALPIWGMYMKDVYADEDLNVSKGEFERPENLSIEINCSEYGKKQESQSDIPDELDF
ncbi:MAG: transglycosylase domain-containing protein [Bacteroidota bacterium]|uniref:Monofunctional biosynthetic peptidoglycan transglycosylase n=1 Tax=Christiangramia flava JLT2011 TaxID=1229726 RepID=A0A1L7I389_9FLAO|nr:transglycosylase domain-containing protein [Christiangramia flava]APU68041.1 Monofunctional biosynthetic peptidoglycan transglycosylase [Christiangramia flava JLT2011]MAM17630.1 penicillin-binding protein [Christiangramia sp.]MEE2772760.1 transglycosylase domain-containing protein [Bacteroidota bacterium]OSS40543.1 Monofunctional biosynthetic peptidoglycan transglycosylase [Christiangramia flava JLT2011]